MPALDRQISIDLALVNFAYTSPRVSAVLGLQAGTWANANYLGADEGWKYVHEASVGMNIDSSIWLKVGIMPSHIGQESSVNKDNMLFTRSMIADATPYYSTGLQIGSTTSNTFKFYFYVLNGWQRITENNNDLSLGSQIVYTPSKSATINWSTYIGNDEPSGTESRTRIHNDLWWRQVFSDAFELVAVFDAAAMKSQFSNTVDKAYYGALKARYALLDELKINSRVEYMHDPHSILTASTVPFKTVGGSVGLDYSPTSNLLIRAEGRVLRSNQESFPIGENSKRLDAFFTVGISVWN